MDDELTQDITIVLPAYTNGDLNMKASELGITPEQLAMQIIVDYFSES
jgi:hypothetical protein